MPRLSSCLSSTTFPNLLSVSQQRNRRTCKCVLGLSRQYVLYSHYESTIYLSALPLVLLLTQPFAARSRHQVQSCVPNPPAVLALTHALSPPSARDACTPPTHRLSGRCGQPEGAPRRARRSAQMQTLSSEGADADTFVRGARVHACVVSEARLARCVAEVVELHVVRRPAHLLRY